MNPLIYSINTRRREIVFPGCVFQVPFGDDRSVLEHAISAMEQTLDNLRKENHEEQERQREISDRAREEYEAINQFFKRQAERARRNNERKAKRAKPV